MRRVRKAAIDQVKMVGLSVVVTAAFLALVLPALGIDEVEMHSSASSVILQDPIHPNQPPNRIHVWTILLMVALSGLTVWFVADSRAHSLDRSQRRRT